jgi:hypothetical protein
MYQQPVRMMSDGGSTVETYSDTTHAPRPVAGRTAVRAAVRISRPVRRQTPVTKTIAPAALADPGMYDGMQNDRYQGGEHCEFYLFVTLFEVSYFPSHTFPML